MKVTSFCNRPTVGGSRSAVTPSAATPSAATPSTLQTLHLQTSPLPHIISSGSDPGESIRHILLGKPDAIRQTIHLLHTLHYTETILWTPVMTIEEPLVITPAQGEAISLLRKQM